ncbi:MAG: T9SS type A sorting domain-containing protein [Flavobacteriales bacterium]|nr:T9SS type A sorting domain-containing protein [Flavobacteriales bacterium]
MNIREQQKSIIFYDTDVKVVLPSFKLIAMHRIFTVSFLFAALTSFGQSHTIDEYEVILEGYWNQTSPAQNTYYNALEDVNLTWNILELEGPSEWEFSFCFPNCYDIGVTEGDLSFTSGTEQYLNCHVYPNQTPGSGWAQMQIVTNELAVDTVTWLITIMAPLPVPEVETSVKIYPNPASSLIQVSVDHDFVNSSYYITDVKGNVVKEGMLSHAMNVLNADKLASGQYTIRIISEEAVITKSLVVTK